MLQPHNDADLNRSGLSSKTIKAARIHSADAQLAAATLNGRDVGPGMAFPYFDVQGQHALTRLKPDQPPVSADGKPAKYLTAKNAGNRLYMPITLPNEWYKDTMVPLIITEGEKKALKATQEGFPCVAVAGVWNFRTKDARGKRGAVADFNDVEWSGRTVYVAYDSDLADNPSVVKAEKCLSGLLSDLGAEVLLCRLPAGPDRAKQGLDDFLVANPPSALLTLLAAAQPARSKARESTGQSAEQLVDAVTRQATLFIDQFKRPFARVAVEEHFQIIPVESKTFTRFLQRIAYDLHSSPANKIVIETAQQQIESAALFNGEMHALHNRVARLGDDLYYDLSDEQWRAVRITADGWSIIDQPPILFRRETHQQPQLTPVSGGDLEDLFEFIPVAQHAQPLLLVWLAACLIPEIAHPILILHGPQGSGKSTAFRYLRNLIDPSIMQTMSLPRSDAITQMLSHHWLTPLDNIDGFSREISDVLCRAVTGDAQMKRAHYTNDDDFIYQYRRCIGINGINIAATRPDLLDRSILIALDRISDTARRTEKALQERWDTIRPRVLGGLLDALSRAIALYPTIQLEQIPRMADFAHWGCAIAEAMGLDRSRFFDAYAANLERQNEEALTSMPMGEAVMALMKETEEWQGTPSDLLSALEDRAVALRLNTGARTWPKAANAVTRRLNEIRANLEQAGIQVQCGKSGQRIIALKTSSANTVQSVQTVQVLQDNDLEADSIWTVTSPVENTVQISSAANPLPRNILDSKDGLGGICAASADGPAEANDVGVATTDDVEGSQRDRRKKRRRSNHDGSGYG